MRITHSGLHPKLLRKVAILAFPVMLSNLLQASISVIDTLMIGRLGPLPIAAVGMGNTLRFFLLITVLSVSGGAMSLAAQSRGSRDKKRLSFVTRQGILSGLMLSIILGLFGVFLARPILSLLNQGGEIEAVPMGTAYVQVLFLGAPFLVLNIVCNRIIQGAGDMITPLLMTFSMLLLNILFNYLFIFGWEIIPAFGVVGAAYGTVLARGILVLFTLWLFHSGRNVVQLLPGSWKPDRAMITDILSIGVPSGIQGIFRHASNLFLIGLATATTLGTYGAAVLAIGVQVEQLIVQPVVGINVAATSLVGQDLGRWQPEAAYQKGILFSILGVGFMVICIIPILLFPSATIYLFDPSLHPRVLEGGISYFNLTLWALPLSAIGIIMTGAMRGAGDTQPAMYSAILNRSLLQLGVGWVLAFPLGLQYAGIWLGLSAGRIIDSIFLGVFWYRRNWKWVALRKTTIYREYLVQLPHKELHEFLEQVRGPTMKVAGTQEIVSKNEVTYIRGKWELRVAFSGKEWKILAKD